MVRAGTCVRSLPSVVAVAVASSPWTAAAAAASRHMHAHMDAYVPTYAYTDPNARSVGFLSRASAERRDEGRRNGSVEPTLPRMTQEQGPGSPNLARWLAGAPAWPCPEQKAKDGSGGDGDGGGGGGGGGERGEGREERGEGRGDDDMSSYCRGSRCSQNGTNARVGQTLFAPGPVGSHASQQKIR